MMATMEREFDLVIFGASGFTGERVIEEIAKHAHQENVRWAIAGRNRNKLRQILVEVQKRQADDLGDIKILEADVTDQTSLEIMCEKTRLIINCVGPYTKFGEAVVAAGIKHRTHVLDMSAELSYIYQMILKYSHEAESRGVYVISACGITFQFFEMAIPAMEQKFPGGIDKIDLHIKPDLKCRSAHFATWESYVNTSRSIYELLVLRQKISSDLLKKTRSKCSFVSLRWPFKLSKEVKGISFVYPSVLLPVHVGLEMKEFAFKEKSVKVNHYCVMDSMLMMVAFSFVIFFLICLFPFYCGKRLLTKHAGFFTCGVVKKSTLVDKTEDTGTLNFTAIGTGWSQKPLNSPVGKPDKTIVLHGSGPPIYKNTVICVVQAALTVLQETDRLPNRGGVYTPLGAFSKTSLPSRMHRNGITYEEKETSSAL